MPAKTTEHVRTQPGVEPPYSPWHTVCAENPGKRIARFIDLANESQRFVELGPDSKIPDGATVTYPSDLAAGLSTDEYLVMLARFDTAWLTEREQTGTTPPLYRL